MLRVSNELRSPNFTMKILSNITRILYEIMLLFLIDFSEYLKQERDIYLTNIILRADSSQDPRAQIVL